MVFVDLLVNRWSRLMEQLISVPVWYGRVSMGFILTLNIASLNDRNMQLIINLLLGTRNLEALRILFFMYFDLTTQFEHSSMEEQPNRLEVLMGAYLSNWRGLKCEPIM